MKRIADRIDEHMTEYPCIAQSNASIEEAVEFMSKMGIRHLPVMEEGKIVGLLSERSAKQALALSGVLEASGLTVADVMAPTPYCVRVGTPLSAVAAEMAQTKMGSAVVLNSAGQVVGIFTTTDGMRILSELLASEGGEGLRNRGVEHLLARGADWADSALI